MNSETNNSIVQTSFEMTDYIRSLKKHFWKVLLISTILTLFVAYLVLKLPSIYSATASIQLDAQEIKPLSMVDPFTLDRSESEYMNTQFQIMKSDRVSQQVIDDLKLKKHPFFNESAGLGYKIKSLTKNFIKSILSDNENKIKSTNLDNNLFSQSVAEQKLLKKFKQNLTLSSVKSSNVILISYESDSPQLSAQIANKIAELYIAQQLAYRVNNTDRTVSWLKEKGIELAKELEISQTKLNSFIKNKNLVDLNDNINISQSEKLKSLIESKNRLESEVLLVKSQLKSVEELDLEDILSNNNLIQYNSVLQTLRNTKILADNKLSVLQERYGPKHPNIIEARASVTQIDKNIKNEMFKVSGDLEFKLKSLQENLSNVNSELNTTQNAFQDISTVEDQYIRLKSEVERLKVMIGTVDTRFKELDIASTFTNEIARIIDYAQVPYDPIKPKKSLIVLAAFVLFILVGTTCILLMVFLNNYYLNIDSIETDLHAKVLGKLPNDKVSDVLTPSYYFENDNPFYTESLRSIRTNFLLSNLASKRKVISITSALPGEGKSSFSLAFALSLAQMHRVLLIDCDLRNPTLSRKVLADPAKPGLTDLIARTHDVEEVIVKLEQYNLSYIPNGQFSENLLELLSSQECVEVIANLKENFDYIILDTAPINLVSDSLVLSNSVDCCVHVIDVENTKKGHVRKAFSSIRNSKIRVDGIVANKVPDYYFDEYVKDYPDYYSSPVKKASI